jgi:Xaa-Pro aminopeptidase
MSDRKIVLEKVDQAVQILQEKDVDLWLTFVRETSHMHDPSLSLVVSPSLQVTWHSAFLISRQGQRIAIVGRYDTENITQTGAYPEVIGYDQSIRQALVETLHRLDPQCIAINYSENDSAADGLTHGMWAQLFHLLDGTPYAARFVSAEDVIAALRGRKAKSEIDRVRAAIKTTQDIFGEVTRFLRPGLRETDIRDYIYDRLADRELDTAWEMEFCPIVNAHPDSPIGHGAPGDYRTEPGHTLHIDFGVTQDGFVSDLQRMWYFLDQGEAKPPAEVQKAFDAVRGAILSAAEVLKPGALGWEVDQAARSYLVKAGYPEYQHATGHHVGRTVHDGASLLGPRWERYGDTPNMEVEAGNIFTLELGTNVPNRGYISLEEDVLVTPNGVEWLGAPQTELWCIR